MRRRIWSAPFVATVAALPACDAPPAVNASNAAPEAGVVQVAAVDASADAVVVQPDSPEAGAPILADAAPIDAGPPRVLPKFTGGRGSLWRDAAGRCWFRPFAVLPPNNCAPGKPCIRPNPPPPHEIECPDPWPGNTSGDLDF